MVSLTLNGVQFMAYSLAKGMMDWDEPIPAFETRFPGKLESCLKTPFATFGASDLYPTLSDKSAMLFYLMIKNHPFQNGNKRIAVTALITFLIINDKWLKISNKDLYDIALRVAKSGPQTKSLVVPVIKEIIESHLTELPQELNKLKNAQD